MFQQWVDGQERSRQVGRILRRCTIGMSSGGAHHVPAPGCCPVLSAFSKFREDGSDGGSSEDESSGESSAESSWNP